MLVSSDCLPCCDCLCSSCLLHISDGYGTRQPAVDVHAAQHRRQWTWERDRARTRTSPSTFPLARRVLLKGLYNIGKVVCRR